MIHKKYNLTLPAWCSEKFRGRSILCIRCTVGLADWLGWFKSWSDLALNDVGCWLPTLKTEKSGFRPSLAAERTPAESSALSDRLFYNPELDWPNSY